MELSKLVTFYMGITYQGMRTTNEYGGLGTHRAALSNKVGIRCGAASNAGHGQRHH